MSAETHLVIYLPVKLISSTKSERLSLHSSFSIKIASLGCIRLKSRLRRSVTYQSKINNINLFNLYIIRISFREFSILQQLRTIKNFFHFKIIWKRWKGIVPVQRKIIMVYKTLVRVLFFPSLFLVPSFKAILRYNKLFQCELLPFSLFDYLSMRLARILEE